MDGHLTFCIQLVEAALLCGFIGLERELAGKPAGLRTNLLICVGAALLTYLSMILASGPDHSDPTRIAAQIVSGIGFLGAGAIIQSRQAVHGLTSAATIWVVAALGMAVGAGVLHDALLAALLVLVALIVLGRVERTVLGAAHPHDDFQARGAGAASGNSRQECPPPAAPPVDRVGDAYRRFGEAHSRMEGSSGGCRIPRRID